MPEGRIDQIELKKLIQNETPVYEKKRKLNQSIGIGVSLLGIGLGLGATISGVLRSNDARISAIFGACAATTQAILFAFPVDKRTAVYRILTAKSKNLECELQIQDLSQERLYRILEEFKAISLEAALEEASPGKMEEAKKLTSTPSMTQDTNDKQPEELRHNHVSVHPVS